MFTRGIGTVDLRRIRALFVRIVSFWCMDNYRHETEYGKGWTFPNEKYGGSCG